MLKTKYHFTEKDTKIIDTYLELLEEGEKVRIKYLLMQLKKQYACYELINYVRDKGFTNDQILYGNSEYLSTMPSGHVILSNDLHFDYEYQHRYVVAKELNIEIEQIKKYLIHHKNGLPGDNDIMNLFICYDKAIHGSYHQAIKHNSNIDIKEFTLDYIEKITTKDNVEEMKDYLKILDKLEKVQNDKKNMFI